VKHLLNENGWFVHYSTWQKEMGQTDSALVDHLCSIYTAEEGVTVCSVKKTSHPNENK
jgi:hypothetical protein